MMKIDILFIKNYVILTIFLFLLGIIIPFSLNKELGNYSYDIYGAVVAIMFIVIIIMLRLYEFYVSITLVMSVYIDWYLGLFITALMMALVLLFFFYVALPLKERRIKPAMLFLWLLFLAITILPAIRGATDRYNTLYYYPDLIFGAFIMFWLGNVIAKDVSSMRRFFQMLSMVGFLIALHIIIQVVTGKFLFLTAQVQSFLASVSDYSLEGATGSGVTRMASFFIQPDAGSAFLAMIFFISLGLLMEEPSIIVKLTYLLQSFAILIALLYTYSSAAWIASIAGLCVYIILAGSMKDRFILIGSAILFFAILFALFQKELMLLLEHTTTPAELLLRQGLWETGWRVMEAFPLTGVGLSRVTYFQVADVYRVPAAFINENNPHNSYLEIGAMAGIPVLLIFLALLSSSLWLALKCWCKASKRGRSLLGAGIASVIVLCINSWSFGIWTFPPIAAFGWIILGVICSPLLVRTLATTGQKENS